MVLQHVVGRLLLYSHIVADATCDCSTDATSQEKLRCSGCDALEQLVNAVVELALFEMHRLHC